MIEKWSIGFPAPTGEEPRHVYVYTPEGDQDMRHPVLYMFDGHNVFFDEDATYGKSWGMAEFAEESALPMIIVAVECNHSPEHGRLQEYSPFTFDMKDGIRVVGRGRTTMDWLVHKLKPVIDAHYPTLPERKYTFLAGSSMGGLISLYGVCRFNHVFSRAACLSPSLWVAPTKINRLIRSADIGDDTVVYMDYGQRELEGRQKMPQYFGKVCQQLLEKGVLLNSRIVPGGTHCEASWEQQIPFFMGTLFNGLD
ncbi:MAG: alpha/beta hydrolase [Clostridia bacterium]|nr:alpha/beta hydrolase [Clostridia bacterium]